MRIFWRLVLLAALHFGVLVCYPDYTAFAPVTVFIVFLLCGAGVIALSGLLSMMGLNKSVAMNFLFDIVMIVVAAVILLVYTPQMSSVRPFDRVAKGQYPTQNDIDRGLAKFGLGSVKQISNHASSAAGKIGDGLQDAATVVHRQIDE